MSLPTFQNLSSKTDDEVKAAIVEVISASPATDSASGKKIVDRVSLRTSMGILTSELDRLLNALVDAGTIVRDGERYRIA